MGSRLEQKVAIVTGSGTTMELPGSGAAIARLFAREGCRVAILDQDKRAAAATLAAIDGSAIPITADVSVEADCSRAVDETLEAYGRLDVIVNNAAITGSGDVITAFSEEEWDRVMAVNVKGAMLLSKHAIPHLGTGGAIINISSGASMRADHANPAYMSSKGALNSLTLSLAAQCGEQGVRVNAVVPSGFWGPMPARQAGAAEMNPEELRALRQRRADTTLLKNEGTAWDVAYATLFMASDEARWITGQWLVVDGGFGVSRERA